MKSDKKVAIMVLVTAIMVVSVFTAVIIGIAAEPSNTQVSAEPPEKIEALQQWIYEQGYNFTVAENWITALSPEEREQLCGYKSPKPPIEPPPENVNFKSSVGVEVGVGQLPVGQPPTAYDAMALGYVTPVKDQGLCGACWIFGATADFESDVLINENMEFNFSEQETGDCNIYYWKGGYSLCSGGNALMTTNYFTKNGSADEACHPYKAINDTCYGCPILKNVDNWRQITGDEGSETGSIPIIKNAILNYGPVYSTINASDPAFGAYSGGVYHGTLPQPTNHAIQIIGWNDSLNDGAWLIKNSWGTGWGAGGPYPGCAWVAYGASNIGDWTSAISGYNNGSVIFYHDECGWMNWCLGYGIPTAYGAVRFTPSQDSTLTAVDFWAVDPGMTYEIKIFDTINDLGGGNYNFSTQLGTTQTGFTHPNEPGYYSIPLSTPVSLVSGDDFIVQVNFTTTGYQHPLPIDYYTAGTHPWLPPWAGIATFSGESYCSPDGTQFVKPPNIDIGIRARVDALEYGDAPDPTYPSRLASDGARHTPTNTECLGLFNTSSDWKDFEPNANVPDLDLLDEGLITNTITAGNPAQTVTFEVSDLIPPSTDLRINILIDLNRDGDWADAGEHVVVNQQITTTPATAEQVVVSNPFSTVGAIPGPTWLRITLTRHDILNPPWNGTMADAGLGWDVFEYGETEDWNITIEEGLLPARVPALTPFGLIALVGLLTIVATSTILRSKRKKR